MVPTHRWPTTRRLLAMIVSPRDAGIVSRGNTAAVTRPFRFVCCLPASQIKLRSVVGPELVPLPMLGAISAGEGLLYLVLALSLGDTHEGHAALELSPVEMHDFPTVCPSWLRYASTASGGLSLSQVPPSMVRESISLFP